MLRTCTVATRALLANLRGTRSQLIPKSVNVPLTADKRWNSIGRKVSASLASPLDKDATLKIKAHEVADRGMENLEGLYGEDDQAIDGLIEKGTIFPTLETHAQLFGGVRYDHLHIIHIRASYNNTLVALCTHDGRTMVRNSCGSEGFKGAKRSTTVAAQATGFVLGKRAVRLGVKNARIVVRGIGQGRLASMKGLQMGGINIVSITDRTAIPHHFKRPRKIRRM